MYAEIMVSRGYHHLEGSEIARILSESVVFRRVVFVEVVAKAVHFHDRDAATRALAATHVDGRVHGSVLLELVECVSEEETDDSRDHAALASTVTP